MQLHYKIQWHLLRPLIRSYFRLSVEGCEHLPTAGPVLLAANHCSYLDPPVIALALPRQITFLAKEELFSVPLMGRWIRWLGAHPVDRNRGDVKALRVAMRLLGEGKALLVFPEGTRSKDGALQPLEQGIAWLSLKASVPIVPLYIDGSYQSMPLGSLFPRPTPIRLLLGEPLIPQDFTRNGVGKTLIAQYTQEIERRLTNLHLTACREDTGKDGKMEIKA